MSEKAEKIAEKKQCNGPELQSTSYKDWLKIIRQMSVRLASLEKKVFELERIHALGNPVEESGEYEVSER